MNPVGIKLCPKCQSQHQLNAQACPCGHVFRTQFVPPSQTVAMPVQPMPGYQPDPYGNHGGIYAMPQKRSSAWAWGLGGLIAVAGVSLFLLWPNIKMTFDRNALTGDWEAKSGEFSSGMIFKPTGEGTFLTNSTVIRDFKWELPRPGFIYIKSEKSVVFEYEFMPGGGLRIGEGTDATVYYRKGTR